MQPRPRVITYSRKNIQKWENQLQEKNPLKLKKYSDDRTGLIEKYKEERAKLGDVDHPLLVDAKSEYLKAKAVKLDGWKQQAIQKEIYLKQQQVKLEKCIDDAEDFLKGMESNPKKEFSKLNDEFLKSFKQYDLSHPIQDIRVRLCLYDYVGRLTTIYNDNLLDAAGERPWRIKYTQLCGFIWDLYDRYTESNENINDDFLQLLVRLVEMTHVKQNRDLPDEEIKIQEQEDQDQEEVEKKSLATGQTCFEHFNLLKEKQEQPAFFHRIEVGFDKEEKGSYAREYLDLTVRSNHHKQYKNKELGSRALALAKAVSKTIAYQEKHQFSQSEERKPEYDLYRRVLLQARELLEEPSDKSEQNVQDNRLERFMELTQHVHGKPCFSRKVLGAMLGLIGAALVAGSVMVALSTFGVATPVSVVGFAIGTTLLWKAGSIAAGVGGIALTGSGMGLFSAGMERSVLKQMNKFEQAVDHKRDKNGKNVLHRAFGG